MISGNFSALNLHYALGAHKYAVVAAERRNAHIRAHGITDQQIRPIPKMKPLPAWESNVWSPAARAEMQKLVADGVGVMDAALLSNGGVMDAVLSNDGVMNAIARKVTMFDSYFD